MSLRSLNLVPRCELDLKTIERKREIKERYPLIGLANNITAGSARSFHPAPVDLNHASCKPSQTFIRVLSSNQFIRYFQSRVKQRIF